MEVSRKTILVKNLNEVLTCKLCHGYYIDATTLVDCLHTFCRGCILRHFENSKVQVQCPVCPVQYKKKSQCFRSDTQIQAIVYKSIPSLYFKEIQRMEEFYRSTGVRGGSSCSDDSLIEKERDIMQQEAEDLISQYIGERALFFNQDDSISLSLEYYLPHLDTTKRDSDKNTVQKPNSSKTDIENNVLSMVSENVSGSESNTNGSVSSSENVCDKRYLQCPAGVYMKHLQKFVRMKYGLTVDHKVDIIYKGEVLPSDFSLMDVAYTFQWEKKNPMRFFYRVFKPLKIRPIKIIKTPTPTGGKKLQIVPVTPISSPVTFPKSPTSCLKSPKPLKSNEAKEVKNVCFAREETEGEQQDKERLFAHLQLQSKSKALQNALNKKPTTLGQKIVKDCVFEYEEPDQDEIKRFAERRDREWALQKKIEEETKLDRELLQTNKGDIGYTSKKRKKSKHSKNDSTSHKEKKRKTHADKIHAEITNNDKSDLKLKVKITTNGHRHKLHKIESGSELTNKEKLLQMRQVRHKHRIDSPEVEESSQLIVPTIKLSKTYFKYGASEPELKKRKESSKEIDQVNIKNADNNLKPQNAEKLSEKSEEIEPCFKSTSNESRLTQSKTLSPGVSRNSALKVFDKELNSKIVPQNSQKSNMYTNDKSSKERKNDQISKETPKHAIQINNKVIITTDNKILNKQIASLQERCTIEPKSTVEMNEKVDKKKIVTTKNEALTSQYPPGFTVSKIESGAKRKADEGKDERPSLEITLIPPSSVHSTGNNTIPKQINRRPPPGTIPLERIKPVNLKSGISIIPKVPEGNKGGNNEVLDLSKANKSPETSPRSSPKNISVAGLNNLVSRQLNNTSFRSVASTNHRGANDAKTIQLSNLQMLSKVAIATEHRPINKLLPNNAHKNRLQVPNLQSINKMSSNLASSNSIRSGSLQKVTPKLNDIHRFRTPNSNQIRSVRPSQNQNIRNIPNPSLVLNNRHQNRLTNPNTAGEKKVASPKASPDAVTSSQINSTKDLLCMKSAIIDQISSEIKEISV